MNKQFNLIKLAIMLIIPIFIIIGSKLTIDKGKQHFTQFNTANINGELASIKIAYKGVQFQLKNEKAKYVFYPNADLLENKLFDDVAEKGDIVIKPAFSDTLKLVKKDKTFLYTFDK